MKLRTHLLTVTAATLAAGLAVLCLAGNVLFARTVTADVHQRLDTRLNAVLGSLRVTNGHVRVMTGINDRILDSYAWVFSNGGRILDSPTDGRPKLRALARRLAASPRARTAWAPGDTLGSRPLRVDGHREPAATVVAAIDTSQLAGLRRAVLWGSISVALLTLLIATVAIRRALNAALAPVERMTRNAEEWEAHDLDRRFDIGPPTNEITALAATLDHLLERIASSRRHEQRFAAEVAHELRTPLAAIRGTAELACNASELDDAHRALAQIENHSDRITTTLDTLIAFARRESGPTPEGVDLEEVVGDFDDVTVRTLNGPLPRVDGDHRIVRQALTPLIDNARRHALSTVTVELSTDSERAIVRVRDDGPGVDPGLGASVFLPGVRGAGQPDDGAGLGLPLALRLARSCGGELSLGDGPGGCFVLSLPVVAGARQQATAPARID